MPKIDAVASALPRHRYSQSEIRSLFARNAGGEAAVGRHLAIFDRSGVQERQFVQPLEDYLRPADFRERNLRFVDHALELGARAVRSCLDAAGAAPGDVSHLIAVTTTGLATPSLDARLAHVLGLRPSVRRTPLFGTGCASGAVGLSRAADALRLRPSERALVVSAELCSLTFQRGDRSVRNLVASALFADGAAAALLSGDDVAGGGPRIEGSLSHLFPDSLDVMGWDFSSDGMHIVLSPEVPDLVRSQFRGLVEGFLRDHGLALRDVGLWLLHPGGLKVVEAYEEALGLGPEDTRLTRGILSRCGNLSSATILLILEDALREESPRPGTIGLAAALGPGFAAELLLLRW